MTAVFSPSGFNQRGFRQRPTRSTCREPECRALTGMDKVDYNALIQLARQARQTTDLDAQKKLLKQFNGSEYRFLAEASGAASDLAMRVASAI